MAAVILQSVQATLSRKRDDGIEFESLVARAERIHRFLIDNSPHILTLPLEDRRGVNEIFKKTLVELNQHSYFLELCLFAQVSPVDAARAKVQDITGGISPDVADCWKRLDAAHCYYADADADTAEQQSLIEALHREWDNDIEAKERFDLLYTGIVNDCIVQLEKIQQQLEENIPMEQRIFCWIL